MWFALPMKCEWQWHVSLSGISFRAVHNSPQSFLWSQWARKDAWRWSLCQCGLLFDSMIRDSLPTYVSKNWTFLSKSCWELGMFVTIAQRSLCYWYKNYKKDMVIWKLQNYVKMKTEINDCPSILVYIPWFLINLCMCLLV